MRLSLSSQEYQLIQPPVPFKPDSRSHSVESYARRLSIGKSEKGVYSVLVEQSQIKVWILDETNGQFMWVSKQLDGQLPELQDRSFLLSQLESHGRWVLQAISSHYYTGPDAGFQPAEPDQFEWDSDNDNILPENGNTTSYKKFITFIGFHHFKEVIFLNDSMVRVLAYHLNSSKIQDLGYAYPEDELYDLLDNQIICLEASFPYTPCWMSSDFPQND
ncbi:hypothetical protein HU200_057161 [Digitaria exilis]|uniref:Uncharacterized protein n=1 Tax=Digitaria exilis TaxID=1010633 RepID=A0A835AFI5_9POAL|nr:hypothetical protein HU200_057161 [Digitaria exilis]